MPNTSTRFDLRNTKVLAVDDNNHALELLVSILTGFRIKDAVLSRSGDEARELISKQSFDLIILDAEMPEEDGFSLLKYTRNNVKAPNFTAPVMLVSAHTPLGLVQRARNSGANIVVKKPIVPGILLRRIEWLAKDRRDFIRSDGYCGPDRRVKRGLAPNGQERRADALALTADMNRALSQDDIDSLFD